MFNIQGTENAKERDKNKETRKDKGETHSSLLQPPYHRTSEKEKTSPPSVLYF